GFELRFELDRSPSQNLLANHGDGRFCAPRALDRQLERFDGVRDRSGPHLRRGARENAETVGEAVGFPPEVFGTLAASPTGPICEIRVIRGQRSCSAIDEPTQVLSLLKLTP